MVRRGTVLLALLATFAAPPDVPATPAAPTVTVRDGKVTVTLGRPRDDQNIGWEIDWFNTLQIYKNLSFQFGFGVLFAGDAMDYAVVGASAGTNKSPNTPFVVTSNLTYSF